MEFRLLGPLEVVEHDRLLALGGQKQRSLLAVLLLNANAVVSTDRLMDELWGQTPPLTAAKSIQVYVSGLRKELGEGRLATRAPGYILLVERSELDLAHFEAFLADAERAVAGKDLQGAVDTLHQALALWRGRPLADFEYAPFAQAPIVRLEELRVAALELRIDAELSLGRHARLIGELQALANEHPLRERLCGQLMLALYRDGRQADALAAYTAARTRLVEEIGIEPGPALQALQRRILEQDPALGREETPSQPPSRSVLVLPGDDAAIEPLVQIGESLAGHGGHELVAVGLAHDAARLPATTSRLHAARDAALERGATVRVAAFTSAERGSDAVRLVAEQEVALLLLDAPESLLDTGVPDADLATVMAQAVCDVALTAGGAPRKGAPVLVPFSGHAHDWAALELGAWLAAARGVPLRLLGVTAKPSAGARDASRLLASASLALQRGMGLATESVLVPAGPEGILEAVQDAAFLVVGLSERWAREGLGAARVAIARRSPCPVLFVRRGLRPGGVAPREALTRFTWSGTIG